MYSKVLLTLDGSDVAEIAIPHAETIARELGIDLTLLQVIPYPEVVDAADEQQLEEEARAYLENVAERLQQNGVNVEVKVRWGKIRKKISECVQASPDSLLVMASHGRTGLAKVMYGSIAESMLHDPGVKWILIVRWQHS